VNTFLGVIPGIGEGNLLVSGVPGFESDEADDETLLEVDCCWRRTI